MAKLTEVYAAKQLDPRGDEYLVLLFADRKVAPEARAPEQLKALAKAGKLKALRVVWRTSYDDIRWVPYDAAVVESGFASEGLGILNLDAFNDSEVEGSVESKQLGQDWHFQVTFKAALASGGMVEVEREASVEAIEGDPVEAPPVSPEANPVAVKRKLAGLGYEYKPESFFYAVSDAKLEAVNLFLASGMSPDTKSPEGTPVLLHGTMFCTHDEPEAREAIALALIAHGAKVDVKDENGSTPLIWAAQTCSAKVVKALLEAGANPNAKAKGGATPLMMAEAMQRAEIAALLKKAGAKP